MISGGEVEFHVQCFSQGSEEHGHELGATIGSDMSGYTMLGENISDEEGGKSGGIDLIRSGDEDALLGKPIDDNQYGCEAGGLGKMLDEVHGDGIPRTSWDRELLNETIGFVAGGLSPTTSRARGDKVVNELSDSGPSVFPSDELNSLINPEVSCKEVVVLVLKDP
jgi:hypothetical protein